jgi:methylenetetrahydrofolate--tRNA-(uracil-5-)-methyltransferase
MQLRPIVSFDSINMSVAFRASRYYRGKQDVGDYINCPMSHDQYEVFFGFLLNAEAIELREFEGQLKNGVTAGSRQYFEGCIPIEVIARRGKKALLFGPFRPVGLVNPHTGKRPYAVVQLRQDNLAGTLYNLVGFQTNLKTAEQKQIIRLIPGLEAGEIVRYGQMHRNTFIYSPALLNPTMQFRNRANLFFGGQITGVEGYVASIATGLLAGLNAARLLQAKPLLELPRETMIGALCYYITHAMPSDYQPMKANFGILPPIELQRRLNKRERAVAYANRSAIVLDASIKCL